MDELHNMVIWDTLKRPPESALKKIMGGRMNGKTDISPQWRLQAMTELFGPVGFGWTYRTVREWTEQGDGGQICAFVRIEMRVCLNGVWSEPFDGTGGSMLVAQEKNGMHTSDEAFKMATTDALSVAMKQLGVAADIYLGNYDGSKYREEAPQPVKKQQRPHIVPKRKYGENETDKITAGDVTALCALMTEKKVDEEKFKAWLSKEYGLGSRKDIPKMLYDEIVETVRRK